MRQAITTKYLSPTNVKGSRIKASCQAGSITLHWDDRLNSTENHRYAAIALASKLEWDGVWTGGFNQDGHGVFIQDDGDAFCISKKKVA